MARGNSCTETDGKLSREKEYQQEMEARGAKTEGGVGLVGYGSQPLFIYCFRSSELQEF